MSDQAKVTLSGKIKTIFPSEVYGNFEKRLIWLEEQNAQYPQTWPIEFTQGDCNVLDKFQAGDMVECHINLRGRHVKKDGKESCFGSFQCWRIRKMEGAPLPPAPQPSYDTAQAQPAADDLPF